MIQGPAVIDDGGIKAPRGRRDQRPLPGAAGLPMPCSSCETKLSAAPPPLNPSTQPGGHNPKPVDAHYQAIRVAMKGVFNELGLAA
jgi:hypothetical protein